MEDLKERTIRGGSVRLGSQLSSFLLRLGSLFMLARLLDPTDFGLVGMVTALTGILNLFRDFGLSAVTVQRANISTRETSMLFWINVLVGIVLTIVTVLLAPTIASFYRNPALFLITVGIAPGFLFNAAGVQHSALLQRQMRFTSLACVEVVSLTVSTAVGIIMAKAGFGYWSLVAMTVSLPLMTTIGYWLTTGWIPEWPYWHTDVRSAMRFGGTLTLNGLVLYISTNIEKVLLGRFWGAEAIGLYGRAYQLIRIPTDNLNSAVGQVAFSALSRIQNDPLRLRSYFVKGYSLVLALTIPITLTCALFADDIVPVVLGPKWEGTVVLLRLLSPTILVFAICNPLGWLLDALGLVGRGLRIALAFAPLMIIGILIGLPYGPIGVAFAYSFVMVVWALPVIAWAVHGTPISFKDILTAVVQPLLSGVVAALIALGVRFCCGHHLAVLPRVVIECVALFGTFGVVLFYIFDRRSFYFGLILSITGRSTATEVAI